MSKSTRRSTGSGQILVPTSVNMSSNGNADASDQLQELVYSLPWVLCNKVVNILTVVRLEHLAIFVYILTV